MELVKVNDIVNYEGRLYLIRPYIEEGKIKRKTVYTDIKHKGCKMLGEGSLYTLSGFSHLQWYQTKFHYVRKGETVTDDTITSERTARFPVKIFTDRESALKALEEYEEQNSYLLNDSIDRQLKILERKRREINKEIKILKDRKKECFKKLTTTFSSKT
jgi:hypothetical protein